MISSTLSQATTQQGWIVSLSCVGFLIFFGFFITVLIWITGSRRAHHYQAMGSLPLDQHATDSQQETQS